MSWEFTHYLITRYNVPLAGWERDAKGVSTLDDAWHQHRFDLFRTFCFPTVLAQSSKNFTWLIYCMKGMKEEYLKPLQTLTQSHAHIQLIFVEGYESCMSDIDRHLHQSITPYVITSRVDNDDGLGTDYIRIIQSRFKPIDGVIINFLHGHGYHTQWQIVTRLRNIRQNHFMSLIEERKVSGAHVSVRGFPHDNIPEEFEIVNVAHKYGWFKTFHERNLKSTIFGMPLLSKRWVQHYGLDRNDVHMDYIRTMEYLFSWLVDGFKRKVLRRETRKRT
jgi:hypothetical protein